MNICVIILLEEIYIKSTDITLVEFCILYVWFTNEHVRYLNISYYTSCIMKLLVSQKVCFLDILLCNMDENTADIAHR